MRTTRRVAALEASNATLTNELAKRDATAAVDGAIKAHKLLPAQREWAEGYAAQDPDGFQELMRHTPDYLEDRVNAMTDIFLARARLHHRRRHGEGGEEVDLAAVRLIDRMKRLADQLTEDIASGLLEPGFASARDHLLQEMRNLLKGISKRSLDPLAKRQGGRHNTSMEAAQERLLIRFGKLARSDDDIDAPTQVDLAAVAPACHRDTIANDLQRAGWDMDEVEVEWRRRARREAGSAR